jgi:hypothetical protein
MQKLKTAFPAVERRVPSPENFKNIENSHIKYLPKDFCTAARERRKVGEKQNIMINFAH